ncbi:MAG: NAD(P)/FAD-dependent oxidoreductase [Burkholderiales bacterium]
MNPAEFEVAVVGGGIAGLTAAWHAAQNGARVVVFAGQDLPGGLVANIGVLEGFPATTPTSGLALAEQLQSEAKALGASIEFQAVERLSASSRGFTLHAANRDWRALKVIAATGASLKPLDVPGAERFRDRGVLQCAWCNAGLFRGRSVMVVGAGDAAFQEAIHLVKNGALVTMVVRGEQVRARRALLDRVAGDETVQLRWSSEVTAIHGDAHLTGIELRDLASGTTETLACDAVFPYIGLAPNSQWLGELVQRSPAGAVVTDSTMRSKTAGLYAIGALRETYRGRLTDALGEAGAAATAVCAELDALR